MRRYAIDDKTSHRAAKFCDHWRESERVSETHSSFGRYYRCRLFWSHNHFTNIQKKKKIKQTEPPEKDVVLEQKSPAGLNVLQDNSTISSIWIGRLGRRP